MQKTSSKNIIVLITIIFFQFVLILPEARPVTLSWIIPLWYDVLSLPRPPGSGTAAVGDGWQVYAYPSSSPYHSALSLRGSGEEKKLST